MALAGSQRDTTEIAVSAIIDPCAPARGVPLKIRTLLLPGLLLISP